MWPLYGRGPMAGPLTRGPQLHAGQLPLNVPPCSPESLPGSSRTLKYLFLSLLHQLRCVAGSLELSAKENFRRAHDCVFKTL